MSGPPVTDAPLEAACRAAYQTFQRALPPAFDDPVTRLYAHGAAWEMAGRLDLALATLRRAVEAADQVRPRLLNALSRCAVALDPAGAGEIAAWLDALAQKKTLPGARLWAAHLFRAAAQPHRAAETLRASLPALGDPALRFGAATELMHALAESDDLAAAIETGRLAIGEHPHAEAGLRNSVAGMLAASGRLEEALAELDRLIVLAPEEPAHHHHRAEVLAGLGRDAEAAAARKRASLLAAVP